MYGLYFSFQPDISEYSTELLPLLFKFMSKAEAEGDKDPRALVNSYYALEQFCENLGQYCIENSMCVKCQNAGVGT